MIMNWMLVAVNALIIVGTIAYAEQDTNEGEDPEDPGEGQIISKRIFLIHTLIFLALRVWEGTGAIQDDKYLKW